MVIREFLGKTKLLLGWQLTVFVTIAKKKYCQNYGHNFTQNIV